MQRLLLCISIISITLKVSAVVALDPTYTIVDVGTLGGASSIARKIMVDGRIVGFSKSGSSDRAFRTAAYTPINASTDGMGTLGGTYSAGYAMNSLGQVVGYAATATDQAYHAFRTAAGGTTLSDLGTLNARARSYSIANAINSSGVVVGVSDTTNAAYYPGHAFRTRPNMAINAATDDLGTLGGSFSEAHDINDAGQVVGYAELPGNSVYHAFRTLPNAAINAATDDLGTLGGGRSVARAINATGWITGSSQVAGGVWHAFRLPPNTNLAAAYDIGTIGGDAHGLDINSNGVVVGTYHLPDDSKHAFIYDGTIMQDLNQLIDACPDWVLVEARGINDDGSIVGEGLRAGATRAFLLRPVAPPRRYGDFDRDCDVDAADFEMFRVCAAGPGIGLDPSCTKTDLDSDGDTDVVDFGLFQRCLSGEGVISNLQCTK